MVRAPLTFKALATKWGIRERETVVAHSARSLIEVAREYPTRRTAATL